MRDEASQLKKHYEHLIKTHKRISRKISSNSKVQNYSALKQSLEQIEHDIKIFQETYGNFIKAQNNNFGEFREEIYRSSREKRFKMQSPYGQERQIQPFPAKGKAYENIEAVKMDSNEVNNARFDQNSVAFQVTPPAYSPGTPLLYNSYKRNMRQNQNYSQNFNPSMASPIHFDSHMGRIQQKPEFSPANLQFPGHHNFPPNNTMKPPTNYNLNFFGSKPGYQQYSQTMRPPTQEQKKFSQLGFTNTAPKNMEQPFNPYQYSPRMATSSIKPQKATLGVPKVAESNLTRVNTTSPKEKVSTHVNESSAVKSMDPTLLLSDLGLPNIDEICLNAKKYRTGGLQTEIEYFMKKWNLKFELTDAIRNEILDSCDFFLAQICKKSINLAKNTQEKKVRRKHVEYAFYEMEDYLLPDSSFVLKNKMPNKKHLKRLFLSYENKKNKCQ